jgi:PAS domain S-box-containing protein
MPNRFNEDELAEQLRRTEALLDEEIRKRKNAERALKKYEDLLILSFQHMPVMVFANDKDGGLIFYNPEFRRVTGFTGDDILEQPGGLDLLLTVFGDHPSHKESSANSNLIREWHFKAKDGSEKVVAWSNISDHCPIEGWTNWGMGLDITELKRMERLRQDMERIVTHDLKTPLNAIIGFSDLILNDFENTEEQKYMITRIQKSGERMLRMIKDCLIIYKIEEGTYIFEPTEVDIVQVFDFIEAELEAIRQTYSLNIVYTIDGNVVTKKQPYMIIGVKSLLENLFANLLKNAMEASPKDARVAVAINSDDNEVCIDIHNLGVIPESVRNRFFERFSTSGKPDGTGLGTYSAHLIAKTHGGSITYDTSDMGGTHVRIFLPKKTTNCLS